MNGPEDLFNLFRFLREPMAMRGFQTWKRQLLGDSQECRKQLAFILATYMKRRQGSDSLLGRPLITLPPIEAKIKIVDLSPPEIVFYRMIEDRIIFLFNKMGQNLVHGVMLTKLMRLR